MATRSGSDWTQFVNAELSPNTQAILLLTAPLLAGRSTAPAELLTPGEYKRFARQLRDAQRSPADLLTDEAPSILRELGLRTDLDRFERLLARGFLLSQVMERWRARAIWVVSRADQEYPSRLKQRLRDDAPPVLYGCGEPTGIDAGGLAVVGSRKVDDELLEYTCEIGRLTARAGRALISGGARGVDRAAMNGALDAGGLAIGVLADGLEKAAMARESRDFLMHGQLLLMCPYDPAAGFNVGNAMQRNKLIYALADAALVVNSDINKGGTWAGAVEQLEKRHLVAVYVRSTGPVGQGLSALRQKGAALWPNPETPDALTELLSAGLGQQQDGPIQDGLFAGTENTLGPATCMSGATHSAVQPVVLADELFFKVRELLLMLECPKSEAEIATELGVSTAQARQWLQRLVDEGALERHSRPVRYGPKAQTSLLD